MAKDDKTIVTKKAVAKPAAAPKKPSTAATKQTAASKTPVAKKVITKKAPATKKVVAKKAPAAKKAVAKKVGVASATAPPTPSPIKSAAPVQQQPPTVVKTSHAVTAKERDAMIRDAAYFRAEKRHFAPGFEADDWADAEREVDELLSRRR